jgi:para-aminobenzoate synthetase/4-amino-4-deoxychorismate lyase
MSPFAPGTVLLHAAADLPCAAGPLTRAGWLLFQQPQAVIEVRSAGEGSASDARRVRAALEQVAAAVAAGQWAAGWLAYEAAPAFEQALRVMPAAARRPLLWFGIYAEPQRLAGLPRPDAPDVLRQIAWRPQIAPEEYAARHARVREYIVAGDTYQVNLTYQLRAAFAVGQEPYWLFHTLQSAQQGRYGAFIQGDDFAIASASPELFFAQRGTRVITRPMKGTAPRGRWLAEDRARAAALVASPKERAENVMIVDLLRNDLGRVARPGCVTVQQLFEAEPYPTVWQLTSTIAAQTDATPLEVLAALFPCGSVTGAPKVRTMEIIAELEAAPRGVYCGAIGFIAPGTAAQFNVAIRTAYCDLAGGCVEYGTGGGVTWGSQAAHEHTEAQLKARILPGSREARGHASDLALFETLLWEPGRGYFLLDEHLARLGDSAAYFGFDLNAARARELLVSFARKLLSAPHRVKLELTRGGELRVQAIPLNGPDRCAAAHEALQLPPRHVGLCSQHVDADDPLMFHKTTARGVYERARAECPACDDVLLRNRVGELTESCIANLVLYLDGAWLTPARECGLLAGVFRESLLRAGAITEARLTLDDLQRAERRFLINSVRGWMAFELI